MIGLSFSRNLDTQLFKHGQARRFLLTFTTRLDRFGRHYIRSKSQRTSLGSFKQVIPMKNSHHTTLTFLLLMMSAGFLNAQTHMTVAYSNLSSTTTGLWMAKEIGAFEKYGIRGDRLFISSGPVAVQALIGGDLHVAIAASNSVVNAIINRAPIIGVGSTANRPYHRLYVQPEINRLEDLRDKTLGVTRFGSLTDNLTRILLRRNGLEGAVNVRQFGGTLEVGAAFSSVRLQAPSVPKYVCLLMCR